MNIGTTGTRASAHLTLAWEIVAELPDETVLVRLTMPPHDDVWYAREAVDGDSLRSLCRCEHLQPDHATHCREAVRGLDTVKHERAQRRIAVLPAPDGAHHMRHCATYWSARSGGACPKCGQLGEVFTPEVRVRDPRSTTWTAVETVEVDVVAVFIDAGLDRDDVRAFGETHGIVWWRNGASRLAEITAALTARGWNVVKLPATVRRVA